MLDAEANRRSRKWTSKQQCGRVLWALSHPLFAFSPRPLWGWRAWFLRLFGARIGAHIHLHPSVRITILWNLDIGDYAAVGDRAILYAVGPIRIGAAATVFRFTHRVRHDHLAQSASTI